MYWDQQSSMTGSLKNIYKYFLKLASVKYWLCGSKPWVSVTNESLYFSISQNNKNKCGLFEVQRRYSDTKSEESQFAQTVAEAGFHGSKDTETTTCHRHGQTINPDKYRAPSPFIITTNIVRHRYIPDGWWAKIGAHLATATAQVLLCKWGRPAAKSIMHFYRRCTFKAFSVRMPYTRYVGGNISKSN